MWPGEARLPVRLPLPASGTPARRALDRPMAIACLVERAPCLPLRMSSISSRTNSPATVLLLLPCRALRRARSRVRFSGMGVSFHASVQQWLCLDRGAGAALGLERDADGGDQLLGVDGLVDAVDEARRHQALALDLGEGGERDGRRAAPRAGGEL